MFITLVHPLSTFNLEGHSIHNLYQYTVSFCVLETSLCCVMSKNHTLLFMIIIYSVIIQY